MFYKKLNINGVEYLLAVNISGEGPPDDSVEAEVGMQYMDSQDGSIYKRTNAGWEKEIVTDSSTVVNQDAQGVSWAAFSDHLVNYMAMYGDIASALDIIIEIQNELIGGVAK